MGMLGEFEVLEMSIRWRNDFLKNCEFGHFLGIFTIFTILFRFSHFFPVFPPLSPRFPPFSPGLSRIGGGRGVAAVRNGGV